ncbi:CAP domain-containing protein [Parvibaculum sp.]|jgi:uncharacterized protein YkwD
MQRLATTATVLVTCALLAACASGGSSMKPQEVSTASLPAEASAAAQSETPLGRAILKAVNDFRATKGVDALASDAILQRAASVHAADMQLRGFFGHHNPDGQGPRERLLTLDPDFNGRVSENIQVVEGQSYASMSDQALAETLVDKWAKSPSHRKNMQAAEMTKSGIGIARSGNRIIAVQVFSGP